ncbi:MAG TPA: OmpA family protein [Bacteroidia bacterium]|nr:OmpA family protein [Bacteroidia bacterium]HNU34200.1 OmpA family protein [Bacteroidia bacterium]
MKLKNLLLAFAFVAFGNMVMAQGSGTYGLPKKKDFDRLSLGLGLGVNWFQGDVQSGSENNSGIWDNIKNPVLGLKVGYQISHSVQLNLRGQYTKFSGDKRDRINYPNAVTGPIKTSGFVEFESQIMQGTFNLNYTFGNISFLQRNKRFHMYGEIGAGFFTFATKVDLSDYDSDKKGAVPGTTVEIVDHSPVMEGLVAAGLGFKYQIKRFDVGMLFTFHKTLTDNIDQVYKEDTESDNFSYVTANVNYTFGKKSAMMEWVNPMEVVYSDMADLKDKMDVMSGDKDKDGVSDLFDKDNSTSEGVKVYGDGTSVDSDGDGIADTKDTDPFSAKGAKVDASGVETDTDGDGVPDSRDLEPGTAKGNLVNFQGVSLAGGPNSASASASAAAWLPSVYFDVDKSAVKKVYHDRLNTVARVMKSNPSLNIKVVGNTDADAGEQYNEKLGLRRAEACRDHLVKVYGIDAARLTVETKGEVEQMATKNKPMNRRVDFLPNK